MAIETMTPAALASACNAVADLAGDALGWIGNSGNAEMVGSQRLPLERELRRGAARARRLGVAAERNMCVGVFGPSQAGKSFLVSVLARPHGGNLCADFDAPAGRRDFISEINPPGEGESTGLVTRFTMRRAPCPAGFPIRLRLLTEADLVRVFANTFLMDGDQSEEPPTAEEINELLTAFSRKAGAAGGAGSGIAADDIWDIREYYEKNFGKSAYTFGLKTFWEEAAEIAPRLSPAERAAFFEILWGRHPQFTELYAALTNALGRLGHAPEVFAAADALFPRERSIIDVKLLAGLDGGGIQDEVALRTPAGQTATLTKPILTALTAELIVPMAEQPWDIFAETDLLDFPGARARFTANIQQTFKAAETPRKDTFLRGKVAYLFDRYVAEQELTSMLLCIPPSNMEVTDLPGLVADWVSATHGATPAERARTECILFFVFTKFDMHLPDNAATGSDPVTRYERRIAASMTDPFGKLADSWVNNWADGRPFDNSFWLRNPNYPAEAFIRYDDAMRELGFVADKEQRLAELRAGCLSVPAVRKHFAAPEAAWDAAMTLNDGGVSYLVSCLGPVCNPAVKTRQVYAQLNAVCRHLHHQLASFYISDDLETRLAEKRAAAATLIESLHHTFTLGKFGEVLEALAVDPDRIADRVLRVPEGVHLSSAPAPAAPATAAAMPARAILPGGARLPGGAGMPGGPTPGSSAAVVGRPGGGAPDGPPRPLLPGGARASLQPAQINEESKNGPQARRTLTREAFQAEAAMQTWVETLHEFVRRPDLYSSFGIPATAADDLVSELIAGSRRFGVQQKLLADLGRLNFALRAEVQARPVATVAGERINAYVARLGAEELAPSHRPKVQYEDGTEVPVFEPKPLRFHADDLPAVESNLAGTFFNDWVFTLYQLFEDNAKSTEGAAVDIEQNSRLGSILRGFEGAMA